MIDIQKARNEFKKFLEKYNDKKDELGFELKVVHTYHVVDNAKKIATSLNLDKEDINLAELIALLHDIGRFEDLIFKNNIWNNKLSIVLPHPSPLNRRWIKSHPEFLNKRIYEIRKIVKDIIS